MRPERQHWISRNAILCPINKQERNTSTLTPVWRGQGEMEKEQRMFTNLAEEDVGGGGGKAGTTVSIS